MNAHGLDFQSARTLGMSKGGRAGALLSDTVILNPSLLGFYNLAAVSGTYYWKNPKADRGIFNVSAIDGTNEYVSAGLAYTNIEKGKLIHLALAKKALPILSFGTHFKRIDDRKENIEYDGGLSASFGLAKDTVSVPFQLSLVADNIRQKFTSITGPREISISGKANVNDIMLLYLDDAVRFYKNGDRTSLYSIATEINLGNELYARLGVFRGAEKGWSIGGGWVGPKIGLNYGYQKESSTTQETRHAATMEIYM